MLGTSRDDLMNFVDLMKISQVHQDLPENHEIEDVKLQGRGNLKVRFIGHQIIVDNIAHIIHIV